MTQAEDIAQEAFVRLWKNCDKVDLDKVAPYLYKIGYNLFIDHTRKTKKQSYVSFEYKEEKTREDGQYLMEVEEHRQKIEQCINGMSDGVKEVFILNRMEGKKYREVAELLDISIKTVEKRMSKALKIFGEIKIKI